jgi:hypothetical protein
LASPTLKDIGLWGSLVQKAFAAKGRDRVRKVNAGALLENDVLVAEESTPALGCAT